MGKQMNPLRDNVMVRWQLIIGKRFPIRKHMGIDPTKCQLCFKLIELILVTGHDDFKSVLLTAIAAGEASEP